MLEALVTFAIIMVPFFIVGAIYEHFERNNNKNR